MTETTITPTSSESVEALRNDYRELMSIYDPAVVKIEREQPPEGAMCLLKITVTAPTSVLTSEKDFTPKPAKQLPFRIQVDDGYPVTKPHVFYRKDFRLASVNVFLSGTQCTDEWHPKTSSLFSITDKTIRDIIHDPAVSRYDSMACPELEDWQKGMERKGAFPTIPPDRLYRKTPPLPARPAAKAKAPSAPPPLPAR